jgi:hypothetical protein
MNTLEHEIAAIERRIEKWREQLRRGGPGVVRLALLITQAEETATRARIMLWRRKNEPKSRKRAPDFD